MTVYAKDSAKLETGFVVCVKNDGYEMDLELLKVYKVLADDSLEPDDIRVIDESGEDYIYPKSYFIPANFPGETVGIISNLVEREKHQA